VELAALLGVAAADAAAGTGGPPGGAAPEADPPRALLVPSILRRCVLRGSVSVRVAVLCCAVLCSASPARRSRTHFFPVQLVGGDEETGTGNESTRYDARSHHAHCAAAVIAGAGRLQLAEARGWMDGRTGRHQEIENRDWMGDAERDSDSKKQEGEGCAPRCA
jgi:hypothetical protein